MRKLYEFNVNVRKDFSIENLSVSKAQISLVVKLL